MPSKRPPPTPPRAAESDGAGLFRQAHAENRGLLTTGSPRFMSMTDKKAYLLFLSVSCMTSIMRASGFFLQAARKASSVFWFSSTDFSVTL